MPSPKDITRAVREGKGRPPSISYFIERPNDEYPTLYTLHEEDQGKYKSLKRLYLEEQDLTEYDFATKYIPKGFKAWERLCREPYFKMHLDQWRKELTLKIKAQELKRIMDLARQGGKEGHQASRFLVTKGYIDKDPKGRPSKQEVINETKRLAEYEMTLDEDYDRLINNLTSSDKTN